MADIFVSYASGNRKWVRILAEEFTKQGWTVWWDRDIPIGQSYPDVIRKAIDAARAVCVVWSNESVASNWVLEEAEEAKRRNILFPVMMDDAPIPFGFRMLNAGDLRGWDGQADHAGLQALLHSLGSSLGGAREIPFEEAMRLMHKFCEHRKVSIVKLLPSDVSSTGAKFVAAAVRDGLGRIYCHLTGGRLGEVYYVRQGISLYYHRHLGGPQSALGLPISNEEIADPTGFPTTFFENGYIDWSPRSREARAVVIERGEEKPLGKPAVV